MTEKSKIRRTKIKKNEVTNSMKSSSRCRALKDIRSNWDIYLMLIPGLLFLLIFKYAPMYGVTIAFQDFNIFQGISGSEWVGLANFRKLIESEEFYRVFFNTLIISLYKIIINFPLPIVIALLLNEIACMPYKKTVQTIIYMPHFLSWIIVGGIFTTILSPSSGLVNQLITALGGESISFMMSNDWFRAILVISAAWKEVGWGAIIYIAAIAGIEQEIYEAASIDGAGKIRKMISITLPGLSSTIILMLILRLGSVLEAGTEQILTMYNSVVYETGDVIGTYVYRMGLGKMEYSFSTAVGLFNSVVGFILITLGNFTSRKLLGKSIW